MDINSARFGSVQINEQSVISFPDGLPGFGKLTRFAIIKCEQTEPIQWLQSIEDMDISIPIINPFLIKPDYEIEVNDDELDSIKTHSEENMIVLNIMVIPDDLQKMTVNLMAPLLINVGEMLGTQIMMDYKPLPLRYPAFDALMRFYKKETEEVGADVGADAQNK
ncbi:MAG TPA: flagellar assembly protein FliW [Clostridiales bacterium]|nr:flagellar assembly protein FliW [Clostridiales bacterium]